MYQVIDVPEDYDSFYNSFKLGMEEISPNWAEHPVQSLRDLVATEVEVNEEEYAHLMPIGLSLAEIAQRIREGHYHAGALEIEAMAGALDCEIVVFHEDGTTSIYGDVAPDRPTIRVKKEGPFYKSLVNVGIDFLFDVVLADLVP